MKRNFMLGRIACIGAKWRGKGKEAEQGGGRVPRAGYCPAEDSSPLSMCSSGLALEVLSYRSLIFM